MPRKTGRDKSPIQFEVETARRIATAAEQDLATATQSLKTLRAREKKAKADWARLQDQAMTDAKLRKQKKYAAARDAVIQTERARRRNETLIKKLKQNAVDKRHILQKIERHAKSFTRELSLLRRGLQSPQLSAAGIVVTGQQIRGARALLAMSQTDFAAAVGVSLGALRKAERSSDAVADIEGFPQKVTRGLARLGVQLISPGFYAGTGGAGVRLSTAASKAQRVKAPVKKSAGKQRRRSARVKAA